MGAIAEKLVDALAMFWQALDDQERRLLVAGTVWAAVSVAAAVSSRRQQERERAELVEQVAARVQERLAARA